MKRTPYLGALVCVIAASGCESTESLLIKTVSEYQRGVPCVDVQVRVNDLPWTASSSDGIATFDMVEPPYTVLVYQSHTSETSGNQYDDVWQLREQAANPLEIAVDGTFCGEWREALIRGTVSGRSDDPTTIVEPRIQPDDSFEYSYQWQGDSPHTVVLRVFETDGAEPPGAYIGYASASATVDAPPLDDSSAPGVTSNVSLDLQAIGDDAVSGRVTVPPGLATDELRAVLYLEFDNEVEPYYLGGGTTTAGSFSFVYPVLASTRAWLHLAAGREKGAQSASLQQVAVPSSDLTFELPAPVELLEPSDGATITSQTIFRWSPSANAGRYSLIAICKLETNGKTHAVNYRAIDATATEASLPTIPDLTLLEGTSCSWSVDWRPAGSSDAERYHHYSESAVREATFE